MICNDKQYNVRRARAVKLRTATGGSDTTRVSGVDVGRETSRQRQIREQLEDLERDVALYESPAKGWIRLTGRLDELGALVIQARKHRGWTQRELAKRLGVQLQRVQRYEASSYRSASLTELVAVACALAAVCDLRLDLMGLPIGCGRDEIERAARYARRVGAPI